MNTWSDFYEIVLVAIAFFCVGRLWGYEAQWKEEDRRAARRRAHRHSQKESN